MVEMAYLYMAILSLTPIAIKCTCYSAVSLKNFSRVLIMWQVQR